MITRSRNDLLSDWISAMKKSGHDSEGPIKILIERSQAMITEFSIVQKQDNEDYGDDGDGHEHHISEPEKPATSQSNRAHSPPNSKPVDSSLQQKPRSPTPLRLDADGKPVLTKQSPRIQKYFEDRKAEERQKAAEAARRERLGRNYEIFDPINNTELVYDYRGKLVPREKYVAPEVRAARRKKIQERRRQARLAFGTVAERCLTSDASEDEDYMSSSSQMMSSLLSAEASPRSKVYVRIMADGRPHYTMSPRRYEALKEAKKKEEEEARRRHRLGQQYDIYSEDGKKMLYTMDGQLVTEEQYRLLTQPSSAASSTGNRSGSIRSSSRRSQRPETAGSQQLPPVVEEKYHFRETSLSPSEAKGYHEGYDPSTKRSLRPPPPWTAKESIDLSWSAVPEDSAIGRSHSSDTAGQ